jgi:hypothetical protein
MLEKVRLPLQLLDAVRSHPFLDKPVTNFLDKMGGVDVVSGKMLTNDRAVTLISAKEFDSNHTRLNLHVIY